MNKIFLSSSNPDLLPVITATEQQVGISRLIKLLYTPPGKVAEPVSKPPFWHPKHVLNKVSDRINTRFRWQEKQLLDNIFQEPESPPLPEKTVEISRNLINKPQGIALIRESSPDLMLVAGAPFLKPEVFNIPKLGTVNLHFGCAPDYRGLHTLFWPLYHRDYGKIGITIHYLDEKLDHGAVLAKGFPAIGPHDNSEVKIYVKCVKLAAEMLPEVVKAFEKGSKPEGRPQPSEGKLYLDKHRLLRHDLYYRFRLKTTVRKLPELPERREYYF